MAIYRSDVYSDDFNRTVVRKENIKSDTPDISYLGSVLIKTPDGNIPVEFPFEESVSVERCFETFDDVLKAFVEEKQKEAQSAIVTPDTEIVTP